MTGRRAGGKKWGRRRPDHRRPGAPDDHPLPLRRRHQHPHRQRLRLPRVAEQAPVPEAQRRGGRLPQRLRPDRRHRHLQERDAPQRLRGRPAAQRQGRLTLPRPAGAAGGASTLTPGAHDDLLVLRRHVHRPHHLLADPHRPRPRLHREHPDPGGGRRPTAAGRRARRPLPPEVARGAGGFGGSLRPRRQPVYHPRPLDSAAVVVAVLVQLEHLRRY